MDLKKLKVGDSVVASKSRGCVIYKAKNGKWYMALNDDEYDYDFDTATHYGPYASEKEAADDVRWNHSNPGGWDEISDGNTPVPKNPTSGKKAFLGSLYLHSASR